MLKARVATVTFKDWNKVAMYSPVDVNSKVDSLGAPTSHNDYQFAFWANKGEVIN